MSEKKPRYFKKDGQSLAPEANPVLSIYDMPAVRQQPKE